MRTEIFDINVIGSEPDSRLCTYIHDYSESMRVEDRPFILICPGGGYHFTSDREAEPLAVRFLAMGYHVAVLRYSCQPAIYPTQLLELAKAMKTIHEYAKEWHVKEDKIFVLGCSAGGHLAASLGMFWHEGWLAEKVGVKQEWLRPAGMILCYPVISSGEFAHRGSFENLLQGEYTEELLEKVSLEKQVSEYTPEAFIWHTYTDGAVPVENSLLLIGAMRKYNIPVEFHMYPVGGHGLATADKFTQNVDGGGIQEECAGWFDLVHMWLEKRGW